MGLDLGALFSGIARGMGSAQEIKLAETLRRAAEQRDLAQRRQLSSEDFTREKELRMMLDRLQGGREEERFTRESDRRATERSEDREFDERKLRQDYLTQKRDRERQEEVDSRQERYYNYLMTRPASGNTSQDRQASDAQIISAENAERARLLRKRDSLEAELRQTKSPSQKKVVQKELDLLTDEYINEKAKAAGQGVSKSLRPDESKGLPAAGPLDAEALMDDVLGGGEQPAPTDRETAIEETARDIADSWRSGAFDVQSISRQLISLVQGGDLSVDEARAIMKRAKELYDEDRTPTETSLNSSQREQLWQASRYLK